METPKGGAQPNNDASTDIEEQPGSALLYA